MSLLHPVPGRARNFVRRLSGARIALRLPVLNLCVALWLLVLLNAPFWRTLWQAAGGWDATRAGFLLSLPVFVLLWVWLTLECLTWGRAARPVLAVVLLVSAAAAYFMNAYAVVFDHTMIANIAETHKAEALELLSPRMLGWLIVLGAVPLWLLARVRVPRPAWHQGLLRKAITLAALAGGVAIVVVPFFQSYASLLRNHRELRSYLVPSNYLAAIHSYGKARLALSDRLEAVALDAKRTPSPLEGAKPTLTVLVVGETARAANWALSGYGRPTTPQLSADAEVINFGQVSSCGTSTTVSLPCMFLDVGRARFTDTLARRRENLLDVLHRVGYSVLWRDNNSGCKDLCERVPHEDLSQADVAGLCSGGECYDEILLHGLQEKLDAFQGDAVIVLHMKGSHGPAYHRRYPPAFEYFTPTCKTAQLERCERAAIVNAYDNTLRYTDHVLARTIELLRRNASRFDASLLYVSDHGESLGERGLYLHGIPYSFAPSEQTRVPMVMWLSQGAQRRFGIDTACLRRMRQEPLSHDYLYHSTIGLLGVQTGVYRAEHDLFRKCRSTDDTPIGTSEKRTRFAIEPPSENVPVTPGVIGALSEPRAGL